MCVRTHLFLVLHEVCVSALLSDAWRSRSPQSQRHPGVGTGDDAQRSQILNQHHQDAVRQHGDFRHVDVMAERFRAYSTTCGNGAEFQLGTYCPLW